MIGQAQTDCQDFTVKTASTKSVTRNITLQSLAFINHPLSAIALYVQYSCEEQDGINNPNKIIKRNAIRPEEEINSKLIASAVAHIKENFERLLLVIGN